MPKRSSGCVRWVVDRSAFQVAHPFFTIGHSTRQIAEFVKLLTLHDIKLVVDVRKMPRSRTNVQYNAQQLAKALSECGVNYRYIPQLGGLRGKSRVVGESVNAFWQNQSFHNYADYALSMEFRSGLGELRELGHARVCAVMCAEAVWWRCHRRIIADYLIAAGETVFHILGPGSADRAHLTKGAIVGAGEDVSYPSVD